MKEEIYPNAPLTEAIVEIRFPGNPALECRRDSLYNEFEEKFPVVKVPHQNGAAVAMAPYQFVSKNKTESILSSIRTVGYSTKAYPGFETFKDAALPILRFAVKEFKLKKLIRIGLRYTNVIQFTREDGCIPVTRFLNVQVSLPKVAPQNFQAFELLLNSKMDKDGHLTTRIESGKTPQGIEALLVDFDYAREGNIDPQNIERLLIDSHSHTKAFFNQLITDQYKAVMRGEVIS